MRQDAVEKLGKKLKDPLAHAIGSFIVNNRELVKSSKLKRYAGLGLDGALYDVNGISICFNLEGSRMLKPFLLMRALTKGWNCDGDYTHPNEYIASKIPAKELCTIIKMLRLVHKETEVEALMAEKDAQQRDKEALIAKFKAPYQQSWEAYNEAQR